MKTSNSELSTYLSLCTQYYDADKPTVPTKEFAFYFEYANQINGPILEPMCGTGRFLIPLMEKGINIQGFDASPYMLQALNKKAAEKKLKAKVWQGFLENLSRKEKYSLIFIPCASFGLITDLSQALLCLQKIYHHLTNDGLFVFEVETLKAVPSQLNLWKGDIKRKSNGDSIVASFLSLPPKNNLFTSICRYELIKKNSIVKTEIENFKIRLYEPKQICSLLKEAGFTSIKLKALHHKKNECDEVLIYECSKKKS